MLYWGTIDNICPQIHYLNAHEQERLRRLSPTQGARFLRSRTFLRQVLSHHLQVPPRSVSISHTPTGKPILVDGSLYFNLSHSQNLIVIAINDRCPVGIDLEQIKPRPFLNLIDRYFAPSEQQWFHRLSDQQCLTLCFYRAWVSKEACSKLLDIPLLRGLKEFNVIPILECNSKTSSWSKHNILIEPENYPPIVLEEGSVPGFRYALAHRTL